MARTVKLILVSEHNNNKYYNMTDNSDGRILIEYGRVGVTKQTGYFDMGAWESKYREKIKKGYQDVTALFTKEGVNNVSFVDITDEQISILISRLQAYARKEISNFYTVGANEVTQKQVDRAQQLIDELINCKDSKCANNIVLNLFTVIPRKMASVRTYLLTDIMFDSQLTSLIINEQALLDTMAGQVKHEELTKENITDNVTILDALGIDIMNTDEAEEIMIKDMLADLRGKYYKSFKVSNRKTKVSFDEYVKNAKNKECKLFFHGSRNENWYSILETGLILRPTNAVISGKMFGYGTYFADKALKSYGYTSGRGSYWAKGTDDTAFMALFNVHLGNQFHIKKYENWCSALTEESLKVKGDYDSLFAEGGADLRNNEFIVYNQAQSNLEYLVQLRG